MVRQLPKIKKEGEAKLLGITCPAVYDINLLKRHILVILNSK